MDANGPSNREMQAQTPPAAPTLCRTGCGFYAHSAFDGMCSKCYKDMVKPVQSSHVPTSASSSGSLSSSSSSSSSSMSGMSMGRLSHSAVDSCGFPNVSTGLPTVLNSATGSRDKDELGTGDQCCGGIVEATASISLDDDTNQKLTSAPKEKVKKKRCDNCKKRVGLTGFDCRCGGHFCGIHRYSDTHSCTFNYRELAQAEIRKHNPVVAAEKVKRI